MDMRFGTWNVISLYRVVSLMTVSRDLSKYRLDLVGVQEVRWEGSGTIPAGKRVEFLNDKMSYIILRGHWFHYCSECSCPNRG
jgi:exonuclease III